MNKSTLSILRALLPALAVSAFTSSAFGQAYYWDPSTTATANVGSNGLLASGTPAAGTWNTNAFWSQNPLSTSAASYVPFTSTGTNPDVIFNTGTDQATNSTVNVTSTVSVNSLTISGSEWTFNSSGLGAINIGAGGLALAATPPTGVQYITQAGAVTTSTGLTNLTASLHGAETMNAAVNLGASQTWTNDAFNNTNQLVDTGTITGPAGNGTLTLTTNINNSGFNFSNVIANGSGGVLNLVVNNLGATPATGIVPTTIEITGTGTKASTYTGSTTIQAGTLAVSQLAANGSASGLGAGTLVNLGSGSTTGTLAFIGTTAGSSTSRSFNIGGAGGAILNDTTTAASGLNLSGNITTSMAASGNLALGTGLATSAATNNVISGSISDGNTGGSNTGTLNIISANTTTSTPGTTPNWTLSGTVNIAGNVNVNGGTFTFTQNDTLGNITVGTSGSAGLVGNVVLNGNTTSSIATQTYTLNGGLLTINGSSDNKLSTVTVQNNGTLTLGANGTLGNSTAINLNGGFLLLSSANNIGGGNSLTIGSAGGGIGVNNYTPTSFPAVTFSGGSGVGVYGLGGTGTGGIGTVPAINALFAGGWSLGAFTGTNGTYTGTSLPTDSNSNYNIGGGGATITIANPILTGANNLNIGGSGGGTVVLPSGNTYSGTTTVINGTVSYASAASSFGTATSAINVGSTAGSQALGLNYSGTGENFTRALNFQGAGNTITLSNNGTGNINYTGASTFNGANTIILGNPTDSFGGSIGAITGASTVTKKGLTNSVWALTGGAGNTYTGNTTINGGVLQTINASDLATSNIISLTGVFSGTPGSATSDAAVWQTQGTLTNTLGVIAGDINWGTNAGFSAYGGTLTLNFNGGGILTWGSNSFSGAGGAPLFMGSTTSNNQVNLTNGINLGTIDAFNEQIYVEKGTGGDSTLLSGVITNGAGTAAASGILKSGKGTLILSNTANSYSGATVIDAGTLIAGGSSAAASSGGVGVFGSGYGPSSGVAAIDNAILMGDGNTGTGGNPTLLIGGAYNIGRAITVNNSGTNNTFTIGGSTDASSTFSGNITFTNTTALNNTFAVSQVATTGTDALNITGNVAGTGSMSFNNVGAVNVTGAISGTTTVTQSGTGTTTFSGINTYSGATNVNAGKLVETGAGDISGAVNVNTGGTFVGQNFAVIANTLTGNGGTISTVDGAIGTLYVKGLALNGGGLAVEFLGNGTTTGALDTVDTSALAGTLTIGAGTTTINITNLGGTAIAGLYPILTYSGTQLTSLGGLTLGSSSMTIDGLSATLVNGVSSTDDTVYLQLATAGGGTTATTYNIAVVAGSSLLHVGASTTVTTTISNTGTGTADTLNYSQLTAASVTANGISAGNNPSGGPLAQGASGASNQQVYTATNAGADSVGATVSATDGTLATPATGSVTGTTINVYSGQSVWAGTSSSGSWGMIGGTGNSTFGTNWGATQGSPGVTSGFASSDTATFGTVAGQSTELVRLDGATPSLSSLIFNTAATNYTVAQGSGGNITFNGGAVSASLTTRAGVHTISAPVTLATNLNIATSGGAQVSLSGAVTGTGGITNTGTGTTVLSGAAPTATAFSGGLAVNAGTVNVTGGVAGTSVGAGTGAITVASGATLGVSGVIGNSVTLANGGNFDTVLGQTGPTVTKGGTVVSGGALNASAGGSTLSFALGAGGTANLMPFNFAAPNENSTYVTILGNTFGEINLASTDDIYVSDLSGGVALAQLSLGTPYLLIQAGTGTLADNNDYSGITTSGGVVNGVTQNGWVTGGSNGNTIGLSGTAVSNTYAARLYLYNGTLQIVPEPSTWAMLVGGLGLLALVRIRKSAKRA